LKAVEIMPMIFKYNKTFAEAPSPATNQAWDEIFPTHGGFFVHPSLAPKRSAFAVFHQLHCLVNTISISPANILRNRIEGNTTDKIHEQDGLRHGFWALQNTIEKQKSHSSTSRGLRKNNDFEDVHNHNEETDLPHIRHCIDLLRQSLMCRPDLTIEVKDEELGGVTGFGTEHQCRDWQQLLLWTEAWENYEMELS
jgi:hypothetical protein